MPAVEKGLEWLMGDADLDFDHLVEYEFPQNRKFGGLAVQSWMDSHESLLDHEGKLPDYRIAPVEVQGYVWLALKLWADFYARRRRSFSKRLNFKAQVLKEAFNKAFLFKDRGYFLTAQALDGHKNQIKTLTGNSLLSLWASYTKDGAIECILEEKYIPDLVKRSFKKDLFDEEAGIRTMNTNSPRYNPLEDSYHNGSFWPKFNGVVHEGLVKWSYFEEAERLRKATLRPLKYFGTLIELYIKKGDGTYSEFRSKNGQVSCRNQAWTAASALDLLTLPSVDYQTSS